ncbi:tetraacyldisaccharide 4'-kinase [Massilia sp. CFBP9012]|uniref:tetraacyldisaccharide 4'-kinase n=1 Tax=Massilia sp. CFBP9012 TaxID=3096531 RepID=UPI002A6A893B|nr:tetraacyldisaccharide 4'-kinase [Massilia sp. CFBP9012]MDY0976399.1 tetraacyldisaccharide 4'-kinase [Massilia sp. CFBP9012]
MASQLESTLTRAWLRRGPLAWALLPLALLFRLLAGLRRLLFRTGLKRAERLPVPVIVVGNIFIGGTGKTPLTIWLAESLRAAGLNPGVISRGHGGQEGAALEVTPQSDPRAVGDEPLLIAARAACPVVVGRRRVQAGRTLLQAHPGVDVLIADDGLQHYALARDVEIVLFDGRGVGNGWLLPAGPLREPPSRRRDFTVVNAPAISPGLAAAVGGQPWRMHLAGEFTEPLLGGRQVPLAQLSDKRIVAAAGIGNPGRFFAMLRAAGLTVGELPLPDHHDFLDDPFAGVDADVILITEKDAVKCRQIDHLKNDPRLWVVPVTAQLDARLAEQIVEKCRGRSLA